MARRSASWRTSKKPLPTLSTIESMRRGYAMRRFASAQYSAIQWFGRKFDCKRYFLVEAAQKLTLAIVRNETLRSEYTLKKACQYYERSIYTITRPMVVMEMTQNTVDICKISQKSRSQCILCHFHDNH